MGSRGRKIVRSYLPPELRPIIEQLSKATGLGESEILRMSLMDLAEKYGLITDLVRGAQKRE